MENNEEEKLLGYNENTIWVKGVKNILLSGIIYFIGYMNWSITWVIVPVIIGVFDEERRKRNLQRRNLVREAALGNEKDVILRNMEDLPPWVFFPDIERVEWINKIIRQLWPNVNCYARDLIRSSFEDKLKHNLYKYSLKGFTFQRIILGNVPFRIGGVVVYDNISRDEIVMDLDVSYAGDCDIKFRLRGLNGGIKNFQLYGRLRVVLKPLIKAIPLVGGLQAFFINKPVINFDLDGIAGVLEIPGINDLLRKCIIDTVSSLMVLPNKFPIILTKDVSGMQLKIPCPAGVLRVHVIEAKNLLTKDISFTGKGKSDPYTILEVGAQVYRTETINCTVNPKWDYWCEVCSLGQLQWQYFGRLSVSKFLRSLSEKFHNVYVARSIHCNSSCCEKGFIILESTGQQINIHVWDEDATDDEYLGKVSVDITNLIKVGQSDLWLSLKEVKHGKIHIRCTWLSLSTDYSDLQAAIYETQYLHLTYMNTALLIVFIDSASNLPQVKATAKPDPYTQVQLGKQTKATKSIMRTINPVWEEGFVFFVSNPDSDVLETKIFDTKTETELCSLSYNISNLSNKESLEIVQQPFRLDKGTAESKIVWSLQLKIFKNYNSEEYLEEYLKDRRQSTASTISKTLKQQSSENPLLPNNKIVEESFDRTSSARSSTMSTVSNARRRSKSKSSNEQIYMGQINLTLRYSVQRQKLIVVVHSLSNIPYRDEAGRNLYVKVYLLPERNKESKRKTCVKNSQNPIYDESFEYLVSQGELNSKRLEISVIEERIMKNYILGQVIIELEKIDLLKTHTDWFDLGPHLKKD